MSIPSSGAGPVNFQLVAGVFDDIDALAARPLDWDQEYEQIGRGPFHGQVTQLILGKLQLGRISWAPGVLQRGTAPKNTWVFGLPIKSEGSLHVRRRPVKSGELLIATSQDDAGFTATGPTELMIAAIPNNFIRRWMLVRRGDIGLNPDLPPRHWAVSNAEMARRSRALAILLNDCVAGSNVEVSAGLINNLESKIADVIFDMIPSAEIIEPLHNRAMIARRVLQVMHERLDQPPTVTELCELVGAKERTLFLSCIEAFGRPPLQLLLEFRLNAVHRGLSRPKTGAKVTGIASNFGFTHYGRFSSTYFKRFGELPSATLARSRGLSLS